MRKPLLAAILSCAGTSLSDAEKRIFAKANPVGISLFARNLEEPTQIKQLVCEIKDCVERDDILIAVDQEGGRVRRLKEPYFHPYGSQYSLGSLPSDEAIKACKLHARLISRDLKELGINVNFAPVLDIAYPQITEALRSRCLSDDIEKISILGKIMVDEYMANGIIPCIKHMPGHGRATNDPHLELPVINATLSEIKKDIIPFKNCNNSPLGMTAHILLPAIDKNHPLTQSKIGINKLIRTDMGFNGLLLSDAIDMQALQGSISERAISSVNAGCDCAVYCMGRVAELSELADNCPKLSDAGLERLDKALEVLHNNVRKAVSKTEEKMYDTLLGQVPTYKESYDATEVLHKLYKQKEGK